MDTVSANPNGGVYAIWTGGNDAINDYDYVVGGQVFVNWKDVHIGPGIYNWDPIDIQIDNLYAKGIPFTVQVNGHHKPDFLFEHVPYYPGPVIISHQVKDTIGTLMYWHPYFKARHSELIAALGEHLENHPKKDYVTGVRTTYNPIGTEHWMDPEEMPAEGEWIKPNGATFYDLDSPENQGHQERIDGYWQVALPTVNRFARPRKPWEYSAFEQANFDAGLAAPYQTASDMQPFYNGNGVEWRFAPLVKWGRGGFTKTYSESHSASDGTNGNTVKHRWSSGEQWMYWHMLFELHLGTSYIAIYGEDLERGQSNPEFADSFDFGNKYAGYHDKPTTSPGAWIAFRKGIVGWYSAHNPDWDLRKDYTFLVDTWVDNEADFVPMSIELDEEGEIPCNARSGCVDYVNPSELGDQTQRYGAWGRKLLAGKNVDISFNSDFVNSTSGQTRMVNVTYLNKGGGTLTVTAFGATEVIDVGTGNQWSTHSYAVGGNNDNVVNLSASGADVVLHMVEIERSQGGSIPVSGVSVSPSSLSLSVGQSSALSAVVSPANATDAGVVWSTSNGSVAMVDSSGLVTGVADGTCSITGTTNDGDFSDSVSVIVTGGSIDGSIDQDFSSGIDGLVPELGGQWDWNSGSGRYELTDSDNSQPAGTLSNLGIHEMIYTGDYTVSGSIQVVGWAGNFDDVALVFGYQSPGNYYYVSLAETNNGNLHGLFKVENGTGVQLKDFDVATSFTEDTYYVVGVERSGSQIVIWVDGTQVSSYTDSTFVGGQVGFGSKDNNAEFDDLLASPLN